MSEFRVIGFDFGQPVSHSKVIKKKESILPIDNIIMVGSYWEKDGMKIRFIPHQMSGVKLKAIFVFEYNDSIHDQNDAEFILSFRSPDTFFSENETPSIIIRGVDILKNLLKDNGRIVTDDKGRNCYYYEIDNISSDLSAFN
jgi:hypothetical protein